MNAPTQALSFLHAMRPLPELPEWQAFCQAAHTADQYTFDLRCLKAAGIQVDLSGQRHSAQLSHAGQALLHAREFDNARAGLLDGGLVNTTEQRAAWHSALRTPAPIVGVAKERERMNEFVRVADSERRWRNIVHIGIGGSDWGVRLSLAAFGYRRSWRQVRFLANIDGHALEHALSGLDPHDTLIVIASKSFTTTETLQNGQRALEWLQAAGVPHPYEQIVAVTARPDTAAAWGIPQRHIFRFWDWVGGRFSLWSAVSLTTALAVSADVVAGMLAGAAAMDQHFQEAPIALNVPVQMALAGIVNRSVLGYGSLNISPYDFRLGNLVPYIQQLDMESLGKSVTLDGEPVGVPTGPAVWGLAGTDAQHTFYQWLHQGSDGAPVDFIICQQADHDNKEHHRLLMANCLAQREALMRGKTYEQALEECRQSGAGEEAEQLARHRVHSGGRPNTLIVLPRLTPFALGALLALYEHKIFVQGLIWGINPFDQWGVEYGKVLAGGIMDELAGAKPIQDSHDASTSHWIRTFKN
ncbi:MAG TPA: glucose-6-phosphate isomerase [Alcaligenes sp.]|nr:glucose-6-phosphate isomerase [Alcaligenes sp.]HRL26134.1 glucose-6-phosphate isomerase [Alcaligenes sp.]